MTLLPRHRGASGRRARQGLAQRDNPVHASRAGSLKEQPAEIPGFRPSGTIVDVRHGHYLHDDPVHSPVIVRRALTSPGERSLFYGTAVERAA
jgi:hypothetical protein